MNTTGCSGECNLQDLQDTAMPELKISEANTVQILIVRRAAERAGSPWRGMRRWHGAAERLGCCFRGKLEQELNTLLHEPIAGKLQVGS